LKKGNKRMLTKKLIPILPLLAVASLTCLAATYSLASQTAAVVTSTSTTSSTAGSDSVLVSRYTKLAGSTANAQSLVTGLRTGTVVTFAATSTTPAVSFTPATQNMGYGNINIALALVKTALTKQGITNPTAAQIAAALNGGSITLTNGTVVTMAGVLTQRSVGMGWGQIAKSMNVKLGSVVSASKSDKAGKKDALSKTDDDRRRYGVVKIETSEKIEKAEMAKNRSSSSESGASSNKSSNSSSSTSSGNSTHSSSGNGGSHSGGNSGGGSGGSGGGGGGGKK
jgi:hypothetical protein